jgi:hypothetical protein
MTETVLIRRRDEEGTAGEPFRPAPPTRGIGRAFRYVAGVNETILDWVPEERARYTRLGAIVVNTGLLAALSMTVLLRTVDLSPLLVVPVALIWGFVILSFDGWLVASTHGVLGMAKLRIFIPRLLISVLMGAVIAEPLLLWMFGPAIETEVEDQRDATVRVEESKYKVCNPATGEPATADGCEDYLLNVGGSPQSIRAELSNVESERDALADTTESINDELTRREELARLECNGTKEDGTTGIVGEGPNCFRNRAEADRYRASSNLDEHQATLVALNERIDRLTEAEGDAGTAYAAAVKTAIEGRVDDLRSNREKIGILDEHQALGALADRSAFVFIGSWLLRLLLITIDCLPVLTKLMNRTTTYDTLLTRQLDIDARLHDKHVTEREQRDTGRADVAIQRNEHLVRTRMEEIDEATRKARADREAVLDDQIEALAARLREGG